MKGDSMFSKFNEESKKEAEEHAAQLGMRGQADGVQFMVDQQGKVLTAH